MIICGCQYKKRSEDEREVICLCLLVGNGGDECGWAADHIAHHSFMESDHEEDLDLGDLSAQDLAECGLSLDDIKGLDQPNAGRSNPDEHADLIADLRALHSGSDFDENALEMTDDDEMKLPSRLKMNVKFRI